MPEPTPEPLSREEAFDIIRSVREQLETLIRRLDEPLVEAPARRRQRLDVITGGKRDV